MTAERRTSEEAAAARAVSRYDSRPQRTRPGALQASEGRFRTLVEHMSDIVVELDSRSPALRWSLAVVGSGRTLHIPDVSLIAGERRAERIDLAERGVCAMLAVPLHTGGRPLGILALERLREVGPWSQREIAEIQLIAGVFSAGLQRLRAEEALQESREQLLHAQKMDAVGRLAGGIAHDFNNLLTVILGYSRSLQDELGHDHPRRDDVCDITRAAERAADLTRQLLAFSRRDPSQAAHVDLNSVVAGVREMIQRMLTRDVELAFDLCAAPCPVWSDARQLEQVLINFVVNARDALGEGGRIAIRTRRIEVSDGERRRFGLPLAGRCAALEVEDDGEGMTEAVRERIFEPFYSTKDVGKGTGLGLSIAYGVAREHGGAVALEVERAQGPVDLIVTDVRMSGMEGGELARRLRSRSPGLPVVYVSGQRFAADAVDQPHGELVQKTFDAAGLLAPIRRALAES